MTPTFCHLGKDLNAVRLACESDPRHKPSDWSQREIGDRNGPGRQLTGDDSSGIVALNSREALHGSRVRKPPGALWRL
jgi:hypothetical protein